MKMEQENKLIGVLGGLGPWATNQFFEMVLEQTEAEYDQDYPDLLIFNRSTTPDRTAYLLGRSTASPIPCMVQDAIQLEKAGCSAIVIPCNTSHVYYDEIARNLHIPVVNLPREVIEEGKHRNITRLGILCTEGTRFCQLYDKAASERGSICVYPSEKNQQCINSLIYDDVKAGNPPVEKKLTDAFDELLNMGCDGLVLGCTELSVASRMLEIENRYTMILDSLCILARKTVELSGKCLRKI